MFIEKRDGNLWADIFWEDLSAETRAELLILMGENGNFDTSPITSINVGRSDTVASAPRISIKPKDGGWLDGYIDNFRFQAKVYDTGSKYGINKGRVSKLLVWDATVGVNACIISYDRGWDRKPQDDMQAGLLKSLLEYLEALPTGAF